MSTQQPSGQMKTLKIIHGALITGPLIFALIVAYKLFINELAPIMDEENMMVFIPMVMAMVTIPMSSFLFNNSLNESLKTPKSLIEKLTAYQTANIIRLAILEGTALFSIVICFITFTWINLVTAGIVFVVMSMSIPTVFRAGEKLQLTKEEQGLLQEY